MDSAMVHCTIADLADYANRAGSQPTSDAAVFAVFFRGERRACCSRPPGDSAVRLSLDSLKARTYATYFAMRQRVFGSLIVCSLLPTVMSVGCGSGAGGGASLTSVASMANVANVANVEGPALWGNLVLLALSVGIFVSTIGLRK
jgi:hypothetical protein